MRKLHYVGSSQKDLATFPPPATKEAVFAIDLALDGEEAINATPLVGFGGRGVLEVIINENSDTYRVVYTVRFALAVYVLHCFKKKSVRGRATPKRDIDLVRRRLKDAESHYQIIYHEEEKKGVNRAMRKRGQEPS